MIAEAEDIFGDGVNGGGAVRVLGRAGRDPRQPGRSRSGARQTRSAQLEGCIPFHGDQRFDSRLLQEETVKPISNYVDLTRRAGTLLLLEERRSTWGPRGDQAVASVPSAK